MQADERQIDVSEREKTFLSRTFSGTDPELVKKKKNPTVLRMVRKVTTEFKAGIR